MIMKLVMFAMTLAFAMESKASLAEDVCRWFKSQGIVMSRHRYHPLVYGRGISFFVSSTSSGESCDGIRSFSFRTEDFLARDGRPTGGFSELEFTDHAITNRSSYPHYYQIKSSQPMIFHRISRTQAEIKIPSGTITGMGAEGQPSRLFARVFLPVRYSLSFDRLTPEDPVMRGCARFDDLEVSYERAEFYGSLKDRIARRTNMCDCIEPWMRLK